MTSELVSEEASRGSCEYAGKRIAILNGLDDLDYSEQETTEIVDTLLSEHVLPVKARDDAAHIAIAAVNGIECILTWNSAHLANPFIRPKIEETLRLLGYDLVRICTPY